MTAFNTNTYDHWANFGVGSSVTTEDISETTMDFGVLRNVLVTTHTLLALDAGKATVEIFVRGAANGAPLEMKNALEIPAHPAPETEDGLLSFDQIFQGAAPKESTETMEAAGRSLVCRRIDRSTTLHGQPFSMSIWLSDEVPGGVVRLEGRMGTGQVTKTTVTAFEKK